MSTAALLDTLTSHVESPVIIEATKETTTATADATERTLTSVDKDEVAYVGSLATILECANERLVRRSLEIQRLLSRVTATMTMISTTQNLRR